MNLFLYIYDKVKEIKNKNYLYENQYDKTMAFIAYSKKIGSRGYAYNY